MASKKRKPRGLNSALALMDEMNNKYESKAIVFDANARAEDVEKRINGLLDDGWDFSQNHYMATMNVVLFNRMKP